jgi:hypothetical protein
MSTNKKMTNKDLSDEEKKKIIDAVRDKRFIWDSNHADHSKRDKTNEAFKEIGEAITTPDRVIGGKFLNFTIF